MPDPLWWKLRVWHTSQQKHNSLRSEAGYNPVNFLLSPNGRGWQWVNFWFAADPEIIVWPPPKCCVREALTILPAI